MSLLDDEYDDCHLLLMRVWDEMTALYEVLSPHAQLAVHQYYRPSEVNGPGFCGGPQTRPEDRLAQTADWFRNPVSLARYRPRSTRSDLSAGCHESPVVCVI